MFLEFRITSTANANKSADVSCEQFESRYIWSVQPATIEHIGEELAIKWDDGHESFIALETLRRACPCAGCKGESDVMGNVYRGPEKVLSQNSFRLMRLVRVGGYAIQPVWADGHTTGIYSYEYLRRLGDAASESRS